MYRTIKSCYTGEELERHERDYGGYNDLPPNFKKITPAEFAASEFFSFVPEKVEYRMAVYAHRRGARPVYTTFVLYHFHDGTGIAVARVYEESKANKYDKSGKRKPHPHGYGARFFRFALCEHRWERSANVGNCLNEYTCQACGMKKQVDSSD